jgi:hypothetical protein
MDFGFSYKPFEITRGVSGSCTLLLCVGNDHSHPPGAAFTSLSLFALVRVDLVLDAFATLRRNAICLQRQ